MRSPTPENVQTGRLFQAFQAWLPHFIKFVKGKSSQGTNEAQKHKSYMFVIPCPIEVLVRRLNNKHCLPNKYAAELSTIFPFVLVTTVKSFLLYHGFASTATLQFNVLF